MFKLFRDPIKQLEKRHRAKLAQAQAAQRAGRMPEFAELSAEAEAIGREIDEARGRAAAEK